MNKDIKFLRAEVRKYVSDWRYAHILAVEEEAVKLAAIYSPEKTEKIRIAAILHDITKDFNTEKQLNLCEKFDIIQNDSHLYPKILHSFTGAEWIRREYPEWVDEEIVSAVRWHTTGRENMTLMEALLHLADYIEPTRKFEDCIRLRNAFYSRLEQKGADRWSVLRETVLDALDMSIQGLTESRELIAIESVKARNWLLATKENNAVCFK
ncbi:MAG: bis(5'-nucleosyl)-tetraphosphatase (symmetrical) YqeK [Clostridia bacterium]|nr:bis(5'-nucleosyl)-tetraphosphatase (symmetrical) YqeK [Clostridia bacterium]